MKPGILNNKKIIVTGAAGFIGSHLVDTLLEMENDVIGIDNLSTGRMDNLTSACKNARFRLARGDIRDIDFLLSQFRDVDAVFHLAAFVSVPQSIETPQICNQVNVDGVLNVLEAARRNDVKKIVFASSSAVYGDSPELPKREDMPLVPISPYGVSKLAGEMYCRVYKKVYNLNTSCLRYFNVFGPRQRDNPYSGVIAIFFGKIARMQPLIIFGDGTQSRDFTYVKDVVESNLLVVTEPKSSGEVFNIAADSPITLNDLAKTMLEVTGRKTLQIQHQSLRAGDIVHSYGNLSKAKKILHYQPKFTLRTGLQDYLRYLDAKFEEKEN